MPILLLFTFFRYLFRIEISSFIRWGYHKVRDIQCAEKQLKKKLQLSTGKSIKKSLGERL